jgi:hypothetical protein
VPETLTMTLKMKLVYICGIQIYYKPSKRIPMKTKILIIALVLIGSATTGQTHDTTTYEYCEVVSITKNLSPIASVDAVNVFIDFGGGRVYSPEAPMKDDKGGDLMFYSQIDCLNYLAKKGWKVGQTTTFFQTGGVTQRSITRYTLSREKYSNLEYILRVPK